MLFRTSLAIAYVKQNLQIEGTRHLDAPSYQSYTSSGSSMSGTKSAGGGSTA